MYQEILQSSNRASVLLQLGSWPKKQWGRLSVQLWPVYSMVGTKGCSEVAISSQPPDQAVLSPGQQTWQNPHKVAGEGSPLQCSAVPEFNPDSPMQMVKTKGTKESVILQLICFCSRELPMCPFSHVHMAYMYAALSLGLMVRINP